MTGEGLARYRVKGGRTHWFEMSMDAEQIGERRMYMRSVLQNHGDMSSLPADVLDSSRLYRMGNGYIYENADGYEFFLSDNKVTQAETEFRRIRSMMPFEFLDCTGKDFNWGIYKTDAEQQKGLVASYIMNFEKFKENGMGLYIYSGVKGSGKTLLSCCLLNEIGKRYAVGTKFCNVLDFLDMTKKGYSGDNRDVTALFEASLLVLDDIGVQMSKEWVDTVLYRLVNSRYTNRLPTIYTSNLPVEKLKVDDRISDRIESTTYFVKLPDEPVRQQERQKEKEKLMEEIKNSL